MVVESPPPQEHPLPGPADSLKASLAESQAPTSEPGPMATTGESTVNGVDTGSDSQRQQHSGNVANGVSPMYPYPPPPPGMYPMRMPHEMFQGGQGLPGQRMMLPMPYPYPPPQPGQPGQPMPPNGYAFPTMMPPPPPGNGNASPSSPSAASPMQPYGPYGMWYPTAGAPPPPGTMPQNGMQPIPMPMGTYPPPQAMYLPQHHADGQNGTENGGPAPKPPSTEQQQHTNGVPWTPGPGGLPPKAVAQTIPCRYFPDCRFGSSCWFLHPGVDSPNPSPPSSNQQDSQPPRPFFTGPLPPPVRYGPTGPWDPSSAPQNSSENSSDASKSYPSPMTNQNTGSYGLMYAPYPYPNGYHPMYQPPTHAQQPPNAGTPQSPPQPSQSMPPQHMSHQLQQNPPSQPHSPPPNMPTVYQVNGTQGGWYPGPFPPGMPVQGVSMQPMSPSHHGQGMMPMSPVSPSMGPNGPLVQGMVMPPQAMSPNGANMPLHSPQHHPAQVPYSISPPYSSAPLHPISPPQQAHPLSPQAHPTSPQSLYGNQPQLSPSVPIMPPRGHHSRRESMSSMSAVPMGQVLGPHLDGNGAMDGSRSPPSAFRDMMDGGFGPGARRGRGGHSNRGSWVGGGSFGPARKTPCAFFPTGKCKNGDHCRFPHIMPDPSAPASPTSPRGGYPGSFGRMGNGTRRPTILGPTLEDKMADLSVKEVDGQENGDGTPRTGGFPKPYSSSPKTRGGRPSSSTPSTPGHRQNTHLQPLQQQQHSQRIPSADDFPVLGGTATPPPPAVAAVAVGNGHGYASAWNGPTAAQVLKSGITAKKAGGPHAAGSSVNGDAVKGTTDGPEPTAGDRVADITTNNVAVETPA